MNTKHKKSLWSEGYQQSFSNMLRVKASHIINFFSLNFMLDMQPFPSILSLFSTVLH